MAEFMSLSPLSLKANGVCLHPLRMGQRAIWQLLQLELLQMKLRDDPCQPKTSFFYILGLLAILRTKFVLKLMQGTLSNSVDPAKLNPSIVHAKGLEQLIWLEDQNHIVICQ